MANKTSPPRRNYNQLKGIAEQFLQKYHPKLTLPIPIEDIVELKIGIKISTIKNLKSEHDIDGFINSEFDEITVDDDVFNHFEKRARFTVAHELGHKILHSKIYSQFEIRTLSEYLRFQNNVSHENQKWLEIQANIFAACVLVPTEKLKEEVSLAIENAGTTHADYSIPYLQDLPKRFNVSHQVLSRRIQKERLLTEQM